MKIQIRFVVLLLVAGFATCQDTDLSEGEESFESEFHVKYSRPEEEQVAAAALAEAEKQINEQNKKFKNGESFFYEQLNEFSDLTRDAFAREKTGAAIPRTNEGRGLGAILPPPSEWYTSPELEELYASRQNPPNSYDATSRGLVTPARNQMSCGSCAAFAATGAHETCMLVSGARMNGLDLSEQMIIDCGYNGNDMNGCHGAHSGSYGRVFANQLKGQGYHEVTYPYLDTQPKLSCTNGLAIYNSGAYVKTPMEDYQCSEAKLKQLVSTYGAAVSYIYASDTAFGNYANGVFAGCTTTSINHAILVVGYGSENGQDYWLVKNSWGPDWGNRGMIKIQRGTGQCGIGGYCYAAQCDRSSGKLSDPPITPAPKPIPPQQECDLSATYQNLNGEYTFRWGNNESKVTCNKSKCRPSIAGPSNACMYICNKPAC
jgi:C1A family cysteine protease